MAIVIGTVVSVVEISNSYTHSTSEVVATAQQLIELTLDAAAEAVYQLDSKIAQDLLNGLMQYDLFIEAAIHDELGNELARVETS